ncbi:hypothetical protein LELG_02697 [Lodderomyces elongisporus NRRL YB-4239]|uniref:Adherence factor n=1 Tax=Lodderomyces elongisporus (strain ATCC 11503 / CBS 2605 / JCM 1781 / NBRC 1676 / NRRL YB-4239) TaxID=379508 RepID=A5DZB0_LODEL|nr:hypothetical protein LELG_02697 [Lodderomyces elongisporus NRRL YB-4239]
MSFEHNSYYSYGQTNQNLLSGKAYSHIPQQQQQQQQQQQSPNVPSLQQMMYSIPPPLSQQHMAPYYQQQYQQMQAAPAPTSTLALALALAQQQQQALPPAPQQQHYNNNGSQYFDPNMTSNYIMGISATHNLQSNHYQQPQFSYYNMNQPLYMQQLPQPQPQPQLQSTAQPLPPAIAPPPHPTSAPAPAPAQHGKSTTPENGKSKTRTSKRKQLQLQLQLQLRLRLRLQLQLRSQQQQLPLLSQQGRRQDSVEVASTMQSHSLVIFPNFPERLQKVLPPPPLSKAPIRPDITVSTTAKRAKRKSKFSQEQDDLIVTLKKKGKNWVEIAEILGVGSYLAARNRYQVIVGQQGNNNSSAWDNTDKLFLKNLLDAAEFEKWRYITAELNKSTGKVFTDYECREVIRELFWQDPSSFGVSEDTIKESIKEKKQTDKIIEQREQQRKKKASILEGRYEAYPSSNSTSSTSSASQQLAQPHLQPQQSPPALALAPLQPQQTSQNQHQHQHHQQQHQHQHQHQQQMGVFQPRLSQLP